MPPRSKPLPKLIDFLRRQPAVIRRIRLDVSVDGCHELPNRHFIDLLRRKAHHSAGPVERSKSQLSVWEFVELFSV